MTEEKIHIDSYIGGRKQSLDAKNFIYSKIYETPSDLSFIISKMENDPNAISLIKSRYICRIKEINNRIKYWVKLVGNCQEEYLTQDDLEFLESGGFFEYKLNKQIFRKTDYRIVDGKMYPILFSFVDDEIKTSLNEKYRDAKVYFFDPKMVGEVSFRKNPNEPIILDKKFFKTTVTPERLLDQYGIYPPFGKVEDENKLFEQILSYIITRPERYKHDLFNDLAWALSNEKDADKYLNQIIEQVKGAR
ncbi:MAG: hypothetical protein ABFD07_05100 [Methanobacterium sp.]